MQIDLIDTATFYLLSLFSSPKPSRYAEADEVLGSSQLVLQELVEPFCSHSVASNKNSPTRALANTIEY